MSNSRFASLARIAILAAFVVPALAACVDESYTAADTQYYANITNPRPELSGQKIRPADIRVYANTVNPHPELMGVPEVDVANGPAATPSK